VSLPSSLIFAIIAPILLETTKISTVLKVSIR
jgi:hypothetical protein